jgi:hypothetical protein
MSNRRCTLVMLLAALGSLAAPANSIPYAPAEYYSAEELFGNLASPTGLWVSSPDDPLAYFYGYIPGLVQAPGAPYGGSANFDLIPVLLADPATGLEELSLALGDTPLPPGGSVLDLTAALEGMPGSFADQDDPPVVPEARTFWLFVAAALSAIGVYRWRRQAPVHIE